MTNLLENLPNELILEIFNYTKIQDLSFGFWNLNQRFNQLIRSLKNLSLVITKSDTYESILFSQQIVRIVIVTLDNINLTPFTNLRSLRLNWTSEIHLKQVRSDILPNLTYLSVPVSVMDQRTVQLALEVFSNRFSSLRYADLSIIHMPELSVWSQSPSLRSLQILSYNINIIPLILQTCVQLTHFQVRIMGEHDVNLSSMPIISNHPLKQFIFIQSPNSKFIFDIIHILYLFPNLKRLDLRLCTRSFVALIEFVSKYFIGLTRFDCHVIEIPNNDENVDINIIRKMHPCYFCIQCTLREDYFCLYTTNRVKNNK